MSTPNSRLIPITDHQGTTLLPEEDLFEPEPGSVVLTEGLHGTAWQRFFSDGRWHPTRGGGSRTWDQLLRKRNLVLVYDCAPRYYCRTKACGECRGCIAADAALRKAGA